MTIVDPPNIVFIMLDTLRSDTFEELLITSDKLSIIKDSFTQYRNCYSPSPWTLPSHVSIFTGKYASEHGIHETRQVKIGPELLEFSRRKMHEAIKIQEVLRNDGYHTYGISSNINVSSFSGFDEGFDYFQFHDFLFLNSKYQQRIEEIVGGYSGLNPLREALKLVSELRVRDLVRVYDLYRKIQRNEKENNFPLEKGSSYVMNQISNSSFKSPFFLFINLNEMHEPYFTHFNSYEAFSGVLGHNEPRTHKVLKIRREYSAEIVILQSFLDNFISWIKRIGKFENTMIVITSDHGQALWEEGFGGHGSFLLDTLIKIPMVIKYPFQNRSSIYNKNVTPIDLFGLFKDTAIGENSSLEYREIVHSESFGLVTPHKLIFRSTPNNLKESVATKLDALDTTRIAAVKENFKLIVDQSNGNIETFMNGKNPADYKTSEDVLDVLFESIKRN